MPSSRRPGRDGVTVLIPAHNEAETIRAIAEGALSHVGHVLVVSDGSTDGTVKALEGLPVEVVEHREKAGKGRRLAEGIASATANGAVAVLTLDADGQHDPADIPAFLAATQEAPDALVLGERRHNRGEMPWYRAWSIAFGDVFIGLGAGRRIRDAQCGMRVYPASLWQRITVPPEERDHFVFETAVLLRAGEAGVEVRRVPIAARYKGVVRRPSHFRPVIDTLRIVAVVARHLAHLAARPIMRLIGLRALR